MNPFDPGSEYGIGPIQFGGNQFFAIVVGWGITAVALAVIWQLMRSPWGRVVKAIREDEDAARALGKNAYWYKLQALILGGVIGGLAGMVQALGKATIQPDSFVPAYTFFFWTVLILGGVGRIWSPVVGAMIFWAMLTFFQGTLTAMVNEGLIPTALMDTSQVSQVRFMLVGVGLALLMVFRPQGIFGSREGDDARCQIATCSRVCGDGSGVATSSNPIWDGAGRVPQTVDGGAHYGGDQTRSRTRDQEPAPDLRGPHCGGRGSSGDPARVITALIGPNGAGKTTLFNLLTGFDRPDSGSVLFDGRDIERMRSHVRARKGLVRTFQLTKALTKLSVLENMKLGAKGQVGEGFARSLVPPLWRVQERAIEERAMELLERFSLAHMASEYAGTLSGGQRKLLEMARALNVPAGVVMLDEPVAGGQPGSHPVVAGACQGVADRRHDRDLRGA